MNPFIKIDWHDGFANMPELLVYEEVVPLSSFVFTQKGSLYYGCDKTSGQVSYFIYSKPSYGFGGHKFTLHMDDGTTKDLLGPWSSRASVMNSAGFPHCVECVYVSQSGHRSSGNMLISRAKELLENSGLAAYYEQVNDHHEIGYDIVASYGGKTCYQCDKNVEWLAPDSRCGECTRYTPEEITGEETFSDEDDWGHDMSDHQIDVECYINLYKSIYGIKPKGVQSMSDEWLQRGIEKLDKLGEENETEK